MTGRMMEPTRARDGSFTIAVSGIREDVWPLYDTMQDCVCEIEIKKHREKRSLTANAYAWALIGQIVKKMGGDVRAEDYYRHLIQTAGIKTDIICVPLKAAESVETGWRHNGTGWLCQRMDSKIDGCINLRLIYGSSAFDSQEMSILINCIIQDAEALGIPTITGKEMEKMISAWRITKGETV